MLQLPDACTGAALTAAVAAASAGGGAGDAAVAAVPTFGAMGNGSKPVSLADIRVVGGVRSVATAVVAASA